MRTHSSYIAVFALLSLATSTFGQSALFTAAQRKFEDRAENARQAYAREVKAAAAEYAIAVQKEQQSGSSTDCKKILDELRALVLADDPRVPAMGKATTIESVKVTEILTKHPKWRHGNGANLYHFERNGNFQLIGTKRAGTWKVAGTQVQFNWSDGRSGEGLTFNEATGTFVHFNGLAFTPVE